MRLRNTRRFWRQCQSVAASTAAIALLTLVSYRCHINNATIVLAFLLVLVLQSLTGESVASVIVAIVAAGCLDFLSCRRRCLFELITRLTPGRW